METKSIVVMGVGDVGPLHEPMAPYSSLAQPILATADIRFAQCERVYTEKGSLQLHGNGQHTRVKPHLASIFSDCRFDVVSVASNHGMDWGAEALLDSIALLHSKGIQTIGAGRNIEEARQPAIVERNGIRVAMLAYCTVLNNGYEAGPDKPGIAPLRAHTYYEPMEYQAGVPPRVITVPYEEDLAAMEADIAAAKRTAHAVIVSLHWGVHFIPRMIADYQPVAAKAAFAAGADLILGHHAHVPKAIGVHGGKVCFYSLSNFMMSSRAKSPERLAKFARRYHTTIDPDYPNLAYGTDAKRSMIAKAVIGMAGVQKVSFLPALIDQQLRPEILRHGDARFDDAVRYMDWASEDFDHKFSVEQDEVVVSGS